MHKTCPRFTTVAALMSMYPGCAPLDGHAPGRAVQVALPLGRLRGWGLGSNTGRTSKARGPYSESEEARTVSARRLCLQEQGGHGESTGHGVGRGHVPPNCEARHTLTGLSPPDGPCWRHKEAACVGWRPVPLLAVAPPSLVGGLRLAVQKAAQEGAKLISDRSSLSLTGEDQTFHIQYPTSPAQKTTGPQPQGARLTTDPKNGQVSAVT